MKRMPLSGFAGALLVLLGGTVMPGWWLQVSLLVRVLPEFTPMAFNTVLCFVRADYNGNEGRNPAETGVFNDALLAEVKGLEFAASVPQGLTLRTDWCALSQIIGAPKASVSACT
jgi:hypothetical protein